MSAGQFRFAYFTPDYDSTVAFYRDGLEFPVEVASSWLGKAYGTGLNKS